VYRFVATEGCDRNRIWQNCIALFYTGGTAMAYNVQNMLLQCLFSVVLHIRILRYTYIIYIVIFLFPKNAGTFTITTYTGELQRIYM